VGSHRAGWRFDLGHANSGLIATWIDSLAIDPQNPHTVYTGDGAGLYESPDGATSWSAAPILPGVGVFGLANDPQNQGTVYASTPNGLYKSIDDGESWVQLPVDPAGPFFPLVIDAQNLGVVYSGGFKSTDGGASWAKLALLPTALAIDCKIRERSTPGPERGNWARRPSRS